MFIQNLPISAAFTALLKITLPQCHTIGVRTPPESSAISLTPKFDVADIISDSLFRFCFVVLRAVAPISYFDSEITSKIIMDFWSWLSFTSCDWSIFLRLWLYWLKNPYTGHLLSKYYNAFLQSQNALSSKSKMLYW